MKSKERHELQQNELAQWLSDVGRKVKPYVWHILGAIVIAILALLLVNMHRSSQRQAEVAGYQAMMNALNTGSDIDEKERPRPEQLLEMQVAAIDQFLASRHGSGPYALQMRLAKADRLYSRSMIGWGNKEDPEVYLPQLEEARNIYRDLLEVEELAPMHAQIAYGQACSVRMLGQLRNDAELLQRGRELLESVQRDYPKSPLAEVASARLDTIVDFRPLTLSAETGGSPGGLLPDNQVPQQPAPATEGADEGGTTEAADEDVTEEAADAADEGTADGAEGVEQ